MLNNQKYRGYFGDCYVLTKSRTKDFINSFLDTFLSNREESADEYQIPIYSNTVTGSYKTANNLIDYLIKNEKEIHTIYWRNKDEDKITHAMCFFTNDCKLILGLSCQTQYPNTSIEDITFKELQDFCKSDIGYITYEEPTSNDTTAFLEIVENTKIRT